MAFSDVGASPSPSGGSGPGSSPGPGSMASSPGTAAQQAGLTVVVRGREVFLPSEMEGPSTKVWPASMTTMKLEKLAVQLDVDVVWSSGHREVAQLMLTPQTGARLNIGGAPEDADRWTPLMVTGEQTLNVSVADSTPSNWRPSGNIMRAMCQHTWEEQPKDEDLVDDNERDIGNADPGESFTVTGGKGGLAGAEGAMASAAVLTGFALRSRVTITSTLYLARIVTEEEKLTHTLLVSGAGTLELQPRLVELRRLSLPRLLAAAQEDAKRGENQAALQKWKHALPIQERLARSAGGRENTKLAGLLHSMGVSFNSLGNGREALSCLRRALAIRQHVHGEEHPDSARTLQAIGVVRVRDGEYHEAFEYFWQALRYYEAFEPDSLDAASTLQAVAGVYGKLGEYSEALECYLRALSIRERELGKENLDVATTLHNLGVVFEKLSDHTEALDSLHRALAVRELRLGPSHPQTARTLHSIGIVYSQLLDYTTALAFYQRALDICQKRPGEGTHAAATLNNMGVVYAKLGHTETAIEHHRRALVIQDKILGPNHSDTAATRYNLHVLMMEVEQSKKKGIFDRLRSFLSTGCSSSDRGDRRKASPSLLSLLCEESDEIDGPLDEPCCCCECCRCASTRTLLHSKDGLPVVTRDQPQPHTRKPARLGFPEPKKRGRGYPAAPADPPPLVDPLSESPGKLSSRGAPEQRRPKDCVDCKLSL
mmetsp:Transcript_123012/g.229855  ORF Transcript_123012/g.229855 Transcript_123012/m.229855 type:complete len:713 (-) Transcript_123012:159-2297(-)